MNFFRKRKIAKLEVKLAGVKALIITMSHAWPEGSIKSQYHVDMWLNLAKSGGELTKRIEQLKEKT